MSLEKLPDEVFWDFVCSKPGTDDLLARIEKALGPYLVDLLDSARHPMVRKEKRWTIYTVVAAIRDAVVPNMQDPDKGPLVRSAFQDIKGLYKERVKRRAESLQG